MKNNTIIENALISLNHLNQTLVTIQRAALDMTSIWVIEDVAVITGLEVETLNRLIERKVIPYYTPNGQQLKLFKREEIFEWLLSNKHNGNFIEKII